MLRLGVLQSVPCCSGKAVGVHCYHFAGPSALRTVPGGIFVIRDKSARVSSADNLFQICWLACPRILTFKIKQIPFCYILTNCERAMNNMCNIEKDTGGGNTRNSKIYYFLSREFLTKLASHTGCAVCLRNDS